MLDREKGIISKWLICSIHHVTRYMYHKWAFQNEGLLALHTKLFLPMPPSYHLYVFRISTPQLRPNAFVPHALPLASLYAFLILSRSPWTTMSTASMSVASTLPVAWPFLVNSSAKRSMEGW